MKFLILFLFTAFISLAYSQVVDVNKQLLWEISGNGIKQKSYLFGSLHSNDKRLFQFSDSLYTAMVNTEKIILETVQKINFMQDQSRLLLNFTINQC